MGLANVRPAVRSRNGESVYWQDRRAKRPIKGYRIRADHVSMRPLCFAIPMAAALWAIGALVGYAYL